MNVAITLWLWHYDAVLFDLDGVLTRTASVNAATWKSVLRRVSRAACTSRFLHRIQEDPGHVYRMDVGQMILAHERHGADISVATVPVPLERSCGFGIVEVDADGRIRAFQEKPAHPRPMPKWPGRACASMGNYLFDPGVLTALLDAVASRGETNFGRHLLPLATTTHRVCAYDFSGNRVPGTLPYEEPHYWRNVGTIEAYGAAHRDALAGPAQRFSLENVLWPIRGARRTGRVDMVTAARVRR